MISEQTQEKIKALEGIYADKRSLVMGALWVLQRHRGGHLTKNDLQQIADLLEIGAVEVQAAASFYTMYRVEKPVGKYHIQVCHNISCELLEAQAIIDHLKKRLEIKVGETTTDGKFSLATVECLGSCGTAPMMQINDDYYENLNTERIDAILERMRQAD